MRPAQGVFVAMGLLSVTLGACAVLTGLDRYSKRKCDGACVDGATDDVSVEARADSAHDATNRDGPADILADEGIDTATASDSGTDGAAEDDGPLESSGCGPLNTPSNCGGCGETCDLSHAAGATCNGTACSYTCAPGWGDCDQTPPNTNGCETPLSQTTSCGACNLACDTEHSTGAACSEGSSCQYSGCKAGWANCEKTPPDTDGCESSLASITSCSRCGAACDTLHSIAATCDSTTCVYAGCASGWADCDKTSPDTDGCESSLDSTTSCAGCGNVCDTLHSQGATCNGDTCQYTGCASGWEDCDATPPDTDGCETHTMSTASCGGCGRTCDTQRSLGATCAGNTCVYTGCVSGWADCNKTPPDFDGCESSMTSTSSCGGCGQVCDATHSVGATCPSAACRYSGCAAGWIDCDSTPPNTNGCESSLSSTKSCGACDAVCDSTTGTASCDGTTCSYACSPGRADCNAARTPDTDGCECATPACCGSGCQIIHSNGLGQPFYDCVAQGTYNQDQATEACAAYTGDASLCLLGVFGVCSSLAPTCYCWQFVGSGAAGLVGSMCGPPTSGSPVWY